MNSDLLIRAGDMRDRVRIESRSTDRDATGGTVETWSEVFTVWGNVNPLAGRELEEAQKLWAEVTAQIEIRYRTGIDSTMRAVSGSVTFDIRGVIDVNSRRRKIQLYCRQRV